MQFEENKSDQNMKKLLPKSFAINFPKKNSSKHIL